MNTDRYIYIYIYFFFYRGWSSDGLQPFTLLGRGGTAWGGIRAGESTAGAGRLLEVLGFLGHLKCLTGCWEPHSGISILPVPREQNQCPQAHLLGAHHQPMNIMMR